ncbi:hypothetical protein [Aureivirga sp. CE67]|uniref:hypothetical protein n=1 Tax=Aureivirga sp. CE67 TaxID=1788983 RepID=UPI0018C95B5B|nr:hypothetical protein [Aureivirga sp. CE67]
MEYLIDFKVNNERELNRDYTVFFFQKHKFTLVEEKVDYLKFEKGSFFQNNYTFKPLNWKSNIEIRYTKNRIIADFKINTTYQIVTKNEKKIWETFINSYKKLLIYKKENEVDLENIKRKNRKNNIKIMFWIILTTVLIMSFIGSLGFFE